MTCPNSSSFGSRMILWTRRTWPISIPQVVEKLEGMLEEWREVALAGQLPEEDLTTGMRQEELQRLKSLGYIQ